MAAFFPNAGRTLTLDIVLASARNPKLRLMKNDVAISGGMVLADVTQADFAGYAEIDLSTMAAASINGSGQGSKSKATCLFTRSSTGSPQNIYGWYIVVDDLTATPILFLGRKFSAPVVVELSGHFVQFDLSVLDTLGS